MDPNAEDYEMLLPPESPVASKTRGAAEDQLPVSEGRRGDAVAMYLALVSALLA